MNISTVHTRLLIVGVAALCGGVVFAQQPAAFQPAPAPLPLQQPIQAQPAPAPVPFQQPVPAQPAQPAAYPPASPPVQQSAADQGQPVVAPPPQGGAGHPALVEGTAGVAAVPSTGIIDAESSMRYGVELSAEALAAAPYLYYNKGKVPGAGKVMYPGNNGFYKPYDNVMVEPTWKRAVPFKVGDTVDVLRQMGKIKIGGQRTRLVARVARGAVVGFVGKRVVVRLVDVWDTVVGSERIAKAVPFVPFYVDNKPVDKEPDIKARVVARVGGTISPYMHQYVVINKGSDAGIRLGDFFKVFSAEHPKRLTEALVEAQVVNVTDKASTLLIQKVYSDRLSLRDEAYLSFRAAVK